MRNKVKNDKKCSEQINLRDGLVKLRPRYIELKISLKQGENSKKLKKQFENSEQNNNKLRVVTLKSQQEILQKCRHSDTQPTRQPVTCTQLRLIKQVSNQESCIKHSMF